MNPRSVWAASAALFLATGTISAQSSAPAPQPWQNGAPAAAAPASPDEPLDLRTCPLDFRSRVIEAEATLQNAGYVLRLDTGRVLAVRERRAATRGEIERLLAADAAQPKGARPLGLHRHGIPDLASLGHAADGSVAAGKFWDGGGSAGDGLVSAPQASPAYQFASRYTAADMKDPVKRDAFLRQVMYWEGQFQKPGIAYNGKSGLTYDGTDLDVQGFPKPGGLHRLTAPSKESIQIATLAKVLAGDPYARILVSADDPSKARERALDILRRKISSFEKFDREYPGFGGFKTWVDVTDQGMTLRPDMKNIAPSLDNGEMLWSMMALVEALKGAGEKKLAARYQAQIDLMARNAGRMFFDAKVGKIRAESGIQDPKLPPDRQHYGNSAHEYYLDDPCEGELFVLFWSLYGKANPADVRRVWAGKAPKPVAFQTKAGTITARRGYWFSSHEEWNLLVAPYLDEPFVRRVLQNNQRLRTNYSADHGFPGLFATAYSPQGDKYTSYGIPGASQQPSSNDAVTPYGAFPVLMTDRNVGLAWYLKTLQQPGMQGPLGARESVAVDGSAAAPVATWDSKETAALATMGGSVDLARRYLKRTGQEHRFLALIGESYRHGFDGTTLMGENVPLALPRDPDSRPPANILSDLSK